MFATISTKLGHNHPYVLSKLVNSMFARNVAMSSAEVRRAFIDYFVKEHDHTFVKSSSVIPKNDPSLVMVNAGMNQFKGTFLNTLEANDPFKELRRAANSQKCIRCGGKHNDLNSVGYDLRHHTFFEMLGNWSFNDYYKKEAIEWSWDLLTNVFKLDKDRLFVTYFEGDEKLGVEEDIEVKEIWSSLGLSQDRIIPMPKTENFWEMAKTGPCGPCSEIHYLLEPNINLSNVSREELMEKLSIEIWNLVFIQYDRKSQDQLVPLTEKFVDTGMGLERIVSIIQGNGRSNYDTDLFTPLFKYMCKEIKCKPYSGSLSDPVDIAYRIVADHMRMVTIAIGDGVNPDGRGAGHKVRSVLRSAYWQVKYEMAHHQVRDVLCALPELIVESLSPAYPEMNERLPVIVDTVNQELDLFKVQIQRSKKMFKQQVRGIQMLPDKTMRGEEAFMFLRKFGAPMGLLRLYSDRYNVNVDYDDLKTWIEKYNN